MGFGVCFYEVQAHHPTDEKPIKTHDKTVKKIWQFTKLELNLDSN
jgi:hypothetical protein